MSAEVGTFHHAHYNAKRKFGLVCFRETGTITIAITITITVVNMVSSTCSLEIRLMITEVLAARCYQGNRYRRLCFHLMSSHVSITATISITITTFTPIRFSIPIMSWIHIDDVARRHKVARLKRMKTSLQRRNHSHDVVKSMIGGW